MLLHRRHALLLPGHQEHGSLQKTRQLNSWQDLRAKAWVWRTPRAKALLRRHLLPIKAAAEGRLVAEAAGMKVREIL